jgi:hypothetical protein
MVDSSIERVAARRLTPRIQKVLDPPRPDVRASAPGGFGPGRDAWRRSQPTDRSKKRFGYPGPDYDGAKSTVAVYPLPRVASMTWSTVPSTAAIFESFGASFAAA